MQPTSEGQPAPENPPTPVTAPAAVESTPATSQEPAPDAAPPVPDLPPYSWRNSEYIYHAKPATWYLGLWLLVIIVSGGLVFLQQWLSIAVAVMMALAITVYTRKEPRELSYLLDNHSITVEGRVLPYSQFRSFSIVQEMSWHEVDLEPTKRFIPRLTLLCDSDEVAEVAKILSAHLPRDDREPDWVERASRRLRF